MRFDCIHCRKATTKPQSVKGAFLRMLTNVYAAGQALFDANDPTHLISRLDEPFFRPMDSFEKSGQYVDGTVFIEGMVYFKGKWYLYYGCADSKVGVAVYDPKNPSLPDPLP